MPHKILGGSWLPTREYCACGKRFWDGQRWWKPYGKSGVEWIGVGYRAKPCTCGQSMAKAPEEGNDGEVDG